MSTATRERADELLSAALDYVTLGWPVLPLHHATRPGPRKGPGRARCSCGNIGCDSQGKHPRTGRGLKAATTDAAVVVAMWRRWPLANVGVLTGVHFDVLDLDGPAALDALDECGPADGGPVDGRMALTGKGVHIYLEPTGAGNRTGLHRRDSGIDWRGRNGYVVAPPSTHYSGTFDEWAPNRGPTCPPGPVPGWLNALVLAPQGPTTPITHPDGPTGAYGRAALEREIGRLALAVPGTRNHTLYASARSLGELVGSGDLPAHDVVAALLAVADHWPDRCKSAATIERGMADGIRSPRDRR
jgi:hypothetical protein